MIGDPTAYLNRPAAELAKRIKERGIDPTFSEADPEDLDDFGYFTPKEMGFEATIAKDGLISVIYLHSPKHHGYKGYDGLIPEHLSFGMSKSQVRSQFGEPDAEGGPVYSPLDPAKIYWDLWRKTGYELHCQYPAACDRIVMITVSRHQPAEPVTDGKASPAIV
jgi:hypothetical protein